MSLPFLLLFSCSVTSDFLWPHELHHTRLPCLFLKHHILYVFALGGSEVKASASNAGDLGSIPGSGRYPGEGNGNPVQYFCLENPMTEKPGRLQSTGLQRVGHDWATSLCLPLGYTLSGGSHNIEFACNATDLGSISGLGRSHGEGNGNPLQNSCLEYSMDRRAWWRATVYRVAKSQTQLSD